MKKALKYIGRFFLFLLIFCVGYAILTMVLTRIVVNQDQPTDKDEIAFYILTNGMHTDLVVPVKNDVMDWGTVFKYEHTLGKDTTLQWVGLGWGDQGIYLDMPTWDDLTFKIAFEAAFFLSKSAIHATFFKSLEENDQCKKITMTKEEYADLVAFIMDTLKKGEDGKPMYIDTDAQYGQNDAFYEANGKYNFTHTCNTWANNGLKASGQRAPIWTPFDTGIFRCYE